MVHAHTLQGVSVSWGGKEQGFGLLWRPGVWHDAAQGGTRLNTNIPQELVVIAGKGVYPLELVAAARRQQVQRLVVMAFRGETDRAVARWADAVVWLRLGLLEALLEEIRRTDIRHAVMVGQITPTHIFNIRLDRAMLDLLATLPVKNAETVFGAVADRLKALGVELLPASLFMEEAMPAPGLLTHRQPTPREEQDIALGLKIAKTTSGLDIGQTVVIKDGIVIAVEAFEGTDATILRAGRLAGRGVVVVKVAKRGHDMRFDIPVIGMHTMKTLRKARASVLAVEARRTILLERDRVLAEADRLGIAITAVATNDTNPSETRP